MNAARRTPSRRRTVVYTLVAAALAAASAPGFASSHREAPFIATQPQVDASDFYMFRSYEPGREGYVTMVANYLPLQDPYGGPNYFKLDPNAVYEIHVTNDGGAVENLTFQFRFQTTNDDNKFNVGGKMVSIPLVQNGSGDVAAPNSPALNVHEKYTLGVIRGPRRASAAQAVTNLTQGGTSFDKPVDYIGTKTIGNYIAYANKHIYDIGDPGLRATAACSWASARTRSSSTWARPSTSSTSSTRRWSSTRSRNSPRWTRSPTRT